MPLKTSEESTITDEPREIIYLLQHKVVAKVR